MSYYVFVLGSYLRLYQIDRISTMVSGIVNLKGSRLPRAQLWKII